MCWHLCNQAVHFMAPSTVHGAWTLYPWSALCPWNLNTIDRAWTLSIEPEQTIHGAWTDYPWSLNLFIEPEQTIHGAWICPWSLNRLSMEPESVHGAWTDYPWSLNLSMEPEQTIHGAWICPWSLNLSIEPEQTIHGAWTLSMEPEQRNYAMKAYLTIQSMQLVTSPGKQLPIHWTN